MSHPHASRNQGAASSFVRVNGKIRAREVRVIGFDGKQLGILSLNDAINLARTHGVDLVEIAPNATPPVCRVVDFGKYRYEQAKRDKESKKHQHANRVKEVQLSPNIDPHDFSVKLGHAVDFLCEDMKVKVTLRFRGREMMHQQFGFDVVNRFIKECTPWGHPDFEPKLVGKGINLMLSPLPRAKRAKHPQEGQEGRVRPTLDDADATEEFEEEHEEIAAKPPSMPPQGKPSGAPKPDGFANNPFANLDSQLSQPG